GDLDLVVNNNNESPFLLENQVSNGNWIKVKANAGPMNSFGYGVKAIAFDEGELQYQELSPVRGYQSSCAAEIHFGLANTSILDSLLIIFPNGTSILEKGVKSNQTLTFDIAKAKKSALNVYQFPKHDFVDYQKSVGLDWRHEENQYNDFEREVLLPHKQSEHGPASAVVDINGDGLDDVFVGGSAGISSHFFIQNEQGKFSLADGLRKDARFEDVDAEFFDVDQDGDMDLLVASGGYQWEANDDLYTHRLYLNDGNGGFKRDADFPKIKSNGKCVSIADWDKDGDQDVFIGSHARPGLYPQNDPSFFLENKSGKLVNVSESICSATLGMVTDAKWGDLTGNNVNELVLVGEWMSPTVLEWKNGAFESSSLNQSLKNTIGWWWTVEVADVNGDGVQDLVAGNIGANNKFHPSNDRPLRIYGNDFDGNGTNDVVLSKMYKDKFVPVRGRECSSEQMPFVKEKFKNFESFSQAKIEEVLGAAMNDALFYEAREFRSGVFINSGFGDFT
ncbi:MAG: FG-GAP-like repeat-containing protein, partial [Flavobacteriales bacterium]